MTAKRWVGAVVVVVALGAAWTASSAGTRSTPRTIGATPLDTVPDAATLVRELARRGVDCPHPVNEHPPAYTTAQFGWPHEIWSCRLLGTPVALDVYASVESRRYGTAIHQQGECGILHDVIPGHEPQPPSYELEVYRANWLVAFETAPEWNDPPTRAQAAPLEAAARRLAHLTHAQTYRGCPDELARPV